MTRWLGKLPSIDPLLLGIYAWLLSDVPRIASEDANFLTKLIGIGALGMLVAGWLVLIRLPRLADVLAIPGFCASTGVLQFGAAEFGPSVPRLVLSCLVWCAFGVAWVRARNHELAQRSRALPAVQLNATSTTVAPIVQLVVSTVAVGCLWAIGAVGVPKADGRGTLFAATLVLATIKTAAWVPAWMGRFERRKSAPPSRRP